MCTGPHTFSTCIDWILGRISERPSCNASFGNVKIPDLDFTDDAVIFAETLDILLTALEVLNEESEPLGLGFPGSQLRSRLSMISGMLLSCLYLSVVTMFWSQRDPPTLAVIFMSLHVVSKKSIDVWVGPESHGFTESWGVVLSVPMQEDETPCS